MSGIDANGVTMTVGGYTPVLVPWDHLEAIVDALPEEGSIPVLANPRRGEQGVEALLSARGVRGLSLAAAALLSEAGVVAHISGRPDRIARAAWKPTLGLRRYEAYHCFRCGHKTAPIGGGRCAYCDGPLSQKGGIGKRSLWPSSHRPRGT